MMFSRMICKNTKNLLLVAQFFLGGGGGGGGDCEWFQIIEINGHFSAFKIFF